MSKLISRWHQPSAVIRGKESEMPSYAEAMAERRAILQAGGFGGEICGEVLAVAAIFDWWWEG